MKFEKDILYIWVGGSCDYGHKERAGGGAYIAQKLSENSKDSANATTIDTFTCAEFHTTEFKMIYAAMNRAIEKFSANPDYDSNKIVFISNVQYIQNFEKKDNVEIKILPYHKFPQQKDVHEMASNAMKKLRAKDHPK